MRYSQGVEWMLHGVALIAQAPDGVAVPRRVHAEHNGLPEPYLAKHLKALGRAGILHANSGPNGGFRLARQPKDISALDIVEAIEGGADPFVCQEIWRHGAAGAPSQACQRTCAFATMMRRAHAAWRDSLRAVTVADLIAMTPKRMRDRNRSKLAQIRAAS